MRLTAHAKINWALNVLGRRPDGYHELDMLVQRIGLADTLELLPADSLEFELVNGGDIPKDDSNLVMRAAMALRAACGVRHGARIRLFKRIPSQAGLGGGSADAAAALEGLNQLWACGLSAAQLAEIGLKLGADVPLCLVPGLMRARGIGECVTKIPGGRELDLVILQPGTGLQTEEVFRRHADYPPEKAADIAAGISALTDSSAMNFMPLVNQLQPAAEALLPDIARAIAALKNAGAVFAQMSGSGSAVFGVFPAAASAARAKQALSANWPVCIQTKTLAS